MALNIAVPLSGLGGLSPISPIGIDCWENIKILVSPIGSESSGVSSLDSEEAKQQVKTTPPRKPEAIKQDIRIYYNGRNVLDLYNNIETNSTTWKFRYSHLPEKNNISMFWANRSLYNRLGPNGLTPVYTINKCECCDFQYTSDCPNNYLSETSLNMSSTTTSPMIFTTAITKTKMDYPNNNNNNNTTQLTNVNNAQNMLSITGSNNTAAAINQQSLAGYNKGTFELTNKQFNTNSNQNYNMNKAKLNDNMFFKKTNNLANLNNTSNNSYGNMNNKVAGTGKTAAELSHLAAMLSAAAAAAGSPANTTPPPNIMMGYNSNAMHQNEAPLTNNAKTNMQQNFFNSLSNPSTPIAAANHIFHNNHMNNTNNSLLPATNSNSSTNKTQISPSNNFYSLFNSGNTTNNNNNNNSAIYAFNANNNNNNNNTYMNSFNSISNTSNNINSNPLTAAANSQHYGRMYKYF